MDDTPEPQAQSRFGESETLVTEAYIRGYPKLVAQARRQLARRKADRSDHAEEIVSRSFYKALLKAPRDSLVRFIVYWRAIVKNELLNDYRHDVMRRRTESALQHELTDTVPSLEVISLQEEQTSSLEEQGRVLLEILEALPARQRLTLRWRLWEGLSSAEVAVRFAAEQGIQICERQALRYFNAGCDACRRALKALEDAKKEGIK